MHDDGTHPESRRRFLGTLLAAPLALAVPSLLGVAGCEAGGGSPTDPSAQPTLACADDDDDDLTPAETEGPYFKRSSPERTSLLETGMAGTRLSLSGLVLTRGCRPVAGALLDFWQADDSGAYDNAGFRLRGHQFTDAAGAFRLETVVPGLYPGRTRHVHVKVQAPGQSVLTTQLYFPGESRNASDGLFHSELLMELSGSGGAREGRFNFVLDLP